MKKRTKALQIPKKVKDAVWERDGRQCIICGLPYAGPWCHYISRAQGGRGVEQNIVTLCDRHHREYDQTPLRKMRGIQIRNYLRSKYPDWDEDKLFYRKER